MNESTLSVEVTVKAEEVAEWCDNQHSSEKKIANRQFFYVSITLIVGILAVFALPRLIEMAEYLGKTDRLPNTQVANAKTKTGQIEDKIKKFNFELTTLNQKMTHSNILLDEAQREIDVINTNLDSRLSEPFTMFRIVNVTNSNSNSIEMRMVIESKNGTLIATGFETGDEIGREMILLRSTDGGKTWSTERPKEDGVRFKATLSALLQTEDGTLIAAGSEKGDEIGRETILLRSTDEGKTWSAERPKEDEVRLKAILSALLQTEDGTLIAAGSEKGDEIWRETILLRSTDEGKTWSAERPKEDEVRLKATLSALLQTEDGTLIAAGSEEGDGLFSRVVLLLRSTDSGETWSAERPKEGDVRIKGTLSALLQTEDGTLIAAGSEKGAGGLIERKVLLLRSTDSGETWSAERPKEDEKTISGNVDSIIQTSDGKFIAVGYKFGISNVLDNLVLLFPDAGNFLSLTISDHLLLYSNDGKSWTEVLLSPEKNDELHPPFTNLIQTKEGIIILTRQGHLPLISLTNTEIEKLRNNSLSLELVLDTEINSLLTDLVKFNETIKFQTGILKQNEKLVISTEDIIRQQSDAVGTLKELTNSLDNAFREAEPVREAGQIATRIAVLGLLIYLVRILFNRYRYHIRLSKFYQGRAQALCLLIADNPNQSLFKNSSLNDLATTLTPETIGFDNIKDTPTVFSSTILNDRK